MPGATEESIDIVSSELKSGSADGRLNDEAIEGGSHDSDRATGWEVPDRSFMPISKPTVWPGSVE